MSVRLTSRVERCSRRTCSFSSSCITCLLTMARVMPSRRPAALKLRSRATSTKISIARNWSMQTLSSFWRQCVNRLPGLRRLCGHYRGRTMHYPRPAPPWPSPPRSTDMLTEAQKEQYQRDGFIVLPNFKSAEEIAVLRARAAEIVDQFDANASSGIFTTKEQEKRTDDYFLGSDNTIRCFFEEEAFGADGQLQQAKSLSINKIGHAMHDLDPVFRAFTADPRLVTLARELGLEQAQVWQSMYIFKQPGIGGEVRWHQDATYFDTTPVSVTTFWFALEDATLDNGCMWAEPGGHRGPMRERFIRNGNEISMEKLDATPWPDDSVAVPLVCKDGSLVCFHGLLPHYSAPNRSAVSRHAYTLHVTDGRTTTRSRTGYSATSRFQYAASCKGAHGDPDFRAALGQQRAGAAGVHRARGGCRIRRHRDVAAARCRGARGLDHAHRGGRFEADRAAVGDGVSHRVRGAQKGAGRAAAQRLRGAAAARQFTHRQGFLYAAAEPGVDRAGRWHRARAWRGELPRDPPQPLQRPSDAVAAVSGAAARPTSDGRPVALVLRLRIAAGRPAANAG